MPIHSSSIIDSSAKIHDSVEIGPFCTIGANVEIEAGTVLKSHVVVKGPSKIGPHNTFFQFCTCLLYTSPSPRDRYGSRMPSSA